MEEEREQRRIYEAKRLKDMKQYTYDFDGNLIQTGDKKEENSVQVVKMK